MKWAGPPRCCKRKEFDFVCSFGSMDKQVAPASSENLHQAMALGGRSIHEDRDARIPSWPGTEVVPLRGHGPFNYEVQQGPGRIGCATGC